MLKTDYKDDVYSGDRKYQETQNADGTVSLEDVTEYTQEGDIFGASDANATNEAVNDLYKVIPVTLTANGWTGSQAPFVQTVNNSEILEKYTYDVVTMIGSNVSEDTAKAYNKALGIINSGRRGNSINGSATFAVFKKPAIDITVGLKVREEAN